MKELTPKRVMSKIRNNRDKEIYLSYETFHLLGSNIGSDDLKKYHFLTSRKNVMFEGKMQNLAKVETILEYDESYEAGVECFYEPPEKPAGILVL